MTSSPGGRLLLVTAHRWLQSARLALAARLAGFEVSLLAPSGHPASELPWVRSAGRYATTRSPQSVARALDRARFDLVVPIDDLAVVAIFQAFKAGLLSPDAAQRIAVSLGDPTTFSTRHDRHAVTAIVGQAGLPAAASWPVDDAGNLDGVLDVAGFPAVLKADTSFGGQGVVVVQDRVAAHKAFIRLSRAEPLHTAALRFLRDDEPNQLMPSLRRTRYSVTVQRFVVGQPATLTAACWQGRVLGSVPLRVLATQGPLGPSVIVEHFEHPDLLSAAQVAVKALGISGLCGLDFLLTSEGRAEFLELNPRATPTAHLFPTGASSPLFSLLAAACASPDEAPLDETPPVLRHKPMGPFSLFPQGLANFADPVARDLIDADVPVEAPEVVDLCQRWVRRPAPSLAARASRWLASREPLPVGDDHPDPAPFRSLLPDQQSPIVLRSPANNSADGVSKGYDRPLQEPSGRSTANRRKTSQRP